MTKIVHSEKLWIICTIIIALIIFIQSGYPSVISNEQFYVFQFDKLVHMSAWVALSFSLRLGLNKTLIDFQNKHSNYFIVLLIALSTLYGITDEVHQMFIPSRSSDILDVLADFIGSIIGVLLANFLINRYEFVK